MDLISPENLFAPETDVSGGEGCEQPFSNECNDTIPDPYFDNFPRSTRIPMRKSSKKIQFFIALLVVPLAISLAVIGFRSEVVKVWLRWIEFLSNVPGLSGLVLLMMSPVIFLLVCLAVKRVSQYFSS